MSSRVEEFLDFVRRSPTAFHAAENIRVELAARGFEELREQEPWRIQPGGKYVITRNRSSVIALIVPERGMAHFQIVASHGDSPTFKLKPVAEDVVCGKYVRLNTEGYGGMIMSSWLDRPLSIAGRVMVRETRGVSTRLVNLDGSAVLIPSMPIHFNREVNDGCKFNAQIDMLPLYGDGSAQGGLLRALGEHCGVAPEAIVGSDLFLYNRDRGAVWGAKGEYFSCPRIDDLECAWTSLQAFEQAQNPDQIDVLAVFDNEEVGSGTKQGADSTFLTDVLSRVAAALGATEAEFRAALASSFMISADNAHAVHPNHPEKYDAGNRVYMNEGVVLKHNANQKYTTDGVSAAIFRMLCEGAGVPVQDFANRSDVRGGSTLGNIANTHASMNTADIGLPQLAMHSACETAGVLDLDSMISAMGAFYATAIRMQSDGAYLLG